ncbi:MAG: hypothetical protein F7B17_03780 [Desulfurococcales archaeon]|nr:hypothetical protein [Desulfurococcales archaeon]
MSEVLELQGIMVRVPSSMDLEELEAMRADVIVAPPEGPERALAEVIASRTSAGLVHHVRPRRALYQAIAYPSSSFGKVVVGVDPGKTCAAVAVADGLVVWLWRGDCVDLPVEVDMLRDDAPSREFQVYVGFGWGGEEAAASLRGVGFEVRGVPEEGSTTLPYHAPAGLLEAIDDEHVLAALTIAYRGLTGWPRRI